VRIYTTAGDLPFKQFTFPDGQRHFELQLSEFDFPYVTIETAIRNGDELLDILLAKQVLTNNGYTVSLDIRYLLGARMDRFITNRQPFTLEVVARVINSAGFKAIRVLDPHSEVSLRYLRAKPVYPVAAARSVLAHYSSEDTVIIAPDTGATERTNRLVRLATRDDFRITQGSKVRDIRTGNLSGFSVYDPSVIKDKKCLIVDDICDGGGTFIGLAKVLLGHGAKQVDLFVTHGIFSKGGKLEGITEIFTTDSYRSVNTIEGPIFLRVDMEKEVSG
jgi:ribose-phosphate pyrophosphokinase